MTYDLCANMQKAGPYFQTFDYDIFGQIFEIFILHLDLASAAAGAAVKLSQYASLVLL